jgi:6-phosphogluconolactonase
VCNFVTPITAKKTYTNLKNKIMKNSKITLAFAITVLLFSACKKDDLEQSPLASDANTAASSLKKGSSDEGKTGHVYVLSNQADGNSVMDYQRASDGSLTLSGSYPTGDLGTGAGLGSQGSVIIVQNEGDDNNDGERERKGDILLAVNAGSNTITSFKIKGNGLDLISTVSSGGLMPISITQSGKLVFVANAGGTGNISGFSISKNGNLQPIANSSRPYSTSNSGPGEIAFVNEGKVLVITEKATNMITSYTVSKSGIPGNMSTTASANQTPFGFAVAKDVIYVTEAAGGMANASTVSSYRVNKNGTISLITGPVSANQTAACWAVITDNNKYVYATNAGSSSVSSFNVSKTGSISVKEAVAGIAAPGAADAALSSKSRYLYVRNGGGASISAFMVAKDGTLNNVQTITGLPAGAYGIAAE